MRACGFCFHFPMASHLQFFLSIDLTNSGSTSRPFPVCVPGYGCSENKPRTNLLVLSQAGQPASLPWGSILFLHKKGCPHPECQLGWSPAPSHLLQNWALPGKCFSTGTKAAAGKRVKNQTVLLPQVTNHALLLLTCLFEQWRVCSSFY